MRFWFIFWYAWVGASIFNTWQTNGSWLMFSLKLVSEVAFYLVGFYVDKWVVSQLQSQAEKNFESMMQTKLAVKGVKKK